MGSITTPEPRLIVITPYDKMLLKILKKQFWHQEWDLVQNNDGVVVRIPLPELTGDRRKELVKVLNKKLKKKSRNSEIFVEILMMILKRITLIPRPNKRINRSNSKIDRLLHLKIQEMTDSKEKKLLYCIIPVKQKSKLPEHIAIIWMAMEDGRLPRSFRKEGHRKAPLPMIDWWMWHWLKSELKIFLYAFSTENWKRPISEVKAILDY